MQAFRGTAEQLGAGGGQLDTGSKIAEAALGPVAQLTVESLPADADAEAAKEPLKTKEKPAKGGLLAVVVIDADAIRRAPDKSEWGGYALYHPPKLDDRVVGDIRDGIRESIRATRIRAEGFDPAQFRALNRVEGETKEITASGEHASLGELNAFIPLVFMILLVMSVMVGGQYLVTTTVEEKSNRVVELLLSAVSPRQLMTGKILGQMCVGMSLLIIYSGLGVGALIAFAATRLLEPMSIVYLLIFFMIAYFMVASTLAAVGSAVNDMREAQSLQTPVMLAVMIPYFLWMPISRDPNSILATVLSFVPPMSPFVMMMRVTSTEPPPTWQVLGSIAVGAVAVYCFIWAAAKIFRVGLLMYGKPPNFATLIRWIRMA
jgi:ABC-2 type transport system permease protein